MPSSQGRRVTAREPRAGDGVGAQITGQPSTCCEQEGYEYVLRTFVE